MTDGAIGVERGEQLTLAGLPAPRRRRPRPTQGEAAATAPVARVCVDLAPPHLDRVFEYVVPAALDAAARPGTRLKVRFGRQDVDGYLLERVDEAEHDGELAPIRRVVSAEPVLSPDVLRLARSVADRYGGTLADVIRLAVPPRHARVEGEAEGAGTEAGAADAGAGTEAGAADAGAGTEAGAAGAATGTEAGGPDAGAGTDAEVADAPAAPAGRAAPQLSGDAWADHRGGGAFLQHLVAGRSPRAAWNALPGPPGRSWADAVAQAVAATVTSGRGALVVVPDARDVGRVLAALDQVGLAAHVPGGRGGVVRLVADDGPAVRYRSFLAVLRGAANVVVGTRAAAFAPVADLGLVVCWDDGDDLHAEPRAPYPHVREVLRLRAEQSGCAALIGGFTRTTETEALVRSGWAQPVQPDRPAVRARTPRVRALTSAELAREGAAAAARLPGEVWRVLRDALERGPVLVQVPRAGYVPVVACARCRAVARCGACHGPLAVTGADEAPRCGWCGRLAAGWRCDACGHGALRSVRVGSDRTAEELGRAFPGVPVRVSGARASGGVLAEVGPRPALVVATPGAEPVCADRYAAGVLLDAAVTTGRQSLRVAEQALRTWMQAAALVRSADEGGVVVLVGDGAPVPTQALVRWDPVGFAQRELDERTQLRLPPAVRTVAVAGTRDAVAAVLARVELPDGAEVLGPVPVDAEPPRGTGALERDVRAVLRAPTAVGAALVRSVAASVAVRSARREGGTVRVQVDPGEVV